MTDLHVSSDGLRAASGLLGVQAGATGGEVAGLSAASTQASVVGAHNVGAHLRNWQTDESGYHRSMAEALTSASRSYESTDQQGAQGIGGVM